MKKGAQTANKEQMTEQAEQLSHIKPKRVITDKELQQHNTGESLWVVVYGKVFDLTDFYMDHSGGWDIIEEYAGRDATQKYEEGNHMPESVRDLKKYYVGEYEGKKLSFQEKKQMVAQEQVEKIKKQKQSENINLKLGLLTGVLLFLMIMYFLYQINKEDPSVTQKASVQQGAAVGSGGSTANSGSDL